ncbi:MAG: sigma-70 family RNA polymerase sigma factor [Bacteroidia bacterium]
MPEQEQARKQISEWVDLYSRDLFARAYHQISDKETAEDLVQDTFIAAYQGISSFQGESTAKTWLFSILNHKIMDYHRRHFRNPVMASGKVGGGLDILEIMFDEQHEWRKQARPGNWETDSENLADKPEFIAVLDKCFRKLPADWSTAMKCKYLEEKEGKEICQDLGITTTNFWQILHRAKLQLRACLELNWFKK